MEGKEKDGSVSPNASVGKEEKLSAENPDESSGSDFGFDGGCWSWIWSWSIKEIERERENEREWNRKRYGEGEIERSTKENTVRDRERQGHRE